VDITPFIRELLFGHDCVIVPGFGGFIGNYTPARIDKTTSTFYPPVKQISFNRNLNHNDGLLSGRISEARGVNYGDARIIIEEFVASLLRRLERGEKVIFDNIGTFNNNVEGNVQFEPDQGVNYHLDSYGLESFQYPLLERYDIRKRITPQITKDPARSAFSRKVLWRAAVIVPLLGLLVVVPLKTDLLKNRIEAITLNPLASVELENNRKVVDEKIVPEPEPIVNEIPVIIDATPAPATVIPASSSAQSYYLITGSFKSRNNAEVQAEKLKNEGFSPEIFDAPNGFYRVSAMSCPDLESALGRKNIISVRFPGTWVKKR
jgi:nucleoid DNA-binding protein